MHLVFLEIRGKSRGNSGTIVAGQAAFRPHSPLGRYLHIRVLFSMILGLGVARLLGGVAPIVQHPKEYRVYWVHLL